MTPAVRRRLAEARWLLLGSAACLAFMVLPLDSARPMSAADIPFLLPNFLFIAAPKLVGWGGLSLSPAPRAARFGALAFADVFAFGLIVWFSVWPGGGDIAWLLYPVGVVPVMLVGAFVAGVSAAKGGGPPRAATASVIRALVVAGAALAGVSLVAIYGGQRRWKRLEIPVDLGAGASSSVALTIPEQTRYQVLLAVDKATLGIDRSACLMKLSFDPCTTTSPLKIAGAVRRGDAIVAMFPDETLGRGSDVSADQIRAHLTTVELSRGSYRIELTSLTDASVLNPARPRLIAEADWWGVSRWTKTGVMFVAVGVSLMLAALLVSIWAGRV